MKIDKKDQIKQNMKDQIKHATSIHIISCKEKSIRFPYARVSKRIFFLSVLLSGHFFNCHIPKVPRHYYLQTVLPSRQTAALDVPVISKNFGFKGYFFLFQAPIFVLGKTPTGFQEFILLKFAIWSRDANYTLSWFAISDLGLKAIKSESYYLNNFQSKIPFWSLLIISVFSTD